MLRIISILKDSYLDLYNILNSFIKRMLSRVPKEIQNVIRENLNVKEEKDILNWIQD